MSALEAQVTAAIHTHKLFCGGERVLVAVSGGLDSMVLLHLLLEAAPELGLKLTVGHFNHQLRGRSSDADEALVRRIAERFGLKLVAGRGKVREFARKEHLSLETAARTLRHQFLGRSAETADAGKIALAHHADDQAELFLLRLLRGAGPEGLSGMKWIAPSPANCGVKLVRPLLACTKAQLAEYASEHGIRFREDRTNACTDMLRNRIRHELLPLLRHSYQPAIDSILLRVAEILSGEDELVRELADKAAKGLTTDRKGYETFATLPAAIQRRYLRSQLLASGIAPEFHVVEHLRHHPGKRITVVGTAGEPVTVHLSPGGQVQTEPCDQPSRFLADSASIRLQGNRGQITLSQVQFRWRLEQIRNAPARPLAAPGYERFDAAMIGSEVRLRHWQPGDRFQPLGTAAPAKLQDIFVNLKVPRQKRHELVLATNTLGEIFWVEGLRISERFKLTPETSRCLHWWWERL